MLDWDLGLDVDYAQDEGGVLDLQRKMVRFRTDRAEDTKDKESL